MTTGAGGWAATASELRSHRQLVPLYCGLLALGLALYWRALDGALFGDDLLYTLRNPWVRDVDFANIRVILDPWGAATRYVTNYAPVHLLSHALLLRVFGDWMPGHHAVNVAVHAAGSLLLGLFFVQRGLSRALAGAGALLFFVHPANVEAVAWVTQLKTTLSFAFCMAALVLFERRPIAATLAFVFALLSKATAAIALPIGAVVLLVDWQHLAPPLRTRRLRALGVWALLFSLFAVSQALAFRGANASVAPLHEDPGWRIASSAAIAGQYLWMALTSLGLSTYHQPRAVTSLGDPRLWLSLAAIAGIAWRALVSLRARSGESVFWVFAVGSWGPVSQIFPFLYPMADRYLYFMLPGLIGALAWFVQARVAAVQPERRGRAQRIALAAALLVGVGFAARAHVRAGVWSDASSVLADAAEHYPGGIIDLGLRARAAVARGNIDEGVAALRGAMAQGFEGLEQVLIDPVYRERRGDPRIEAVLRDLATIWTGRLARRERLTQIEWRQLARAQLVLGDATAARESYRAGLREGGPLDDAIRRDLKALVRRVRSDDPRAANGGAPEAAGIEGAASPSDSARGARRTGAEGALEPRASVATPTGGP